MRAWSSPALLVLAACGSSPGDSVAVDAAPDALALCHFTSGRPCAPGTTCLGAQGNECNYATCAGGQLLSTSIACGAATYPAAPSGPLVGCDPAALAVHGTPPPAPCALGDLRTITAAGAWGPCVSTRQCRPLPCDATWLGDGCPSFHRCDAATSTCVLAPP